MFNTRRMAKRPETALFCCLSPLVFYTRGLGLFCLNIICPCSLGQRNHAGLPHIEYI